MLQCYNVCIISFTNEVPSTYLLQFLQSLIQYLSHHLKIIATHRPVFEINLVTKDNEGEMVWIPRRGLDEELITP